MQVGPKPGLAAACTATVDFTAKDCAKGTAQQCTDGAIAICVDGATQQRATGSADDQTGRTVVTLAVIAAIAALPHAVATANLTRFVIAAAIVIIAVTTPITSATTVAAIVTIVADLITVAVVTIMPVVVAIAVRGCPGRRSLLRNGGCGGNCQRGGGDCKKCLVYGDYLSDSTSLCV